jgi:amino acid adenylation domain-containing protein
LLAVLKAGASYVPLDVKYPVERFRRILQDFGAKLVLVSDEHSIAVPSGAERVVLRQVQSTISRQPATDPPDTHTAEDLAYVIYTSGSTGEPKGVAVPHRAVVRLVKETNYASFGPDEVFLQFAPLSFDASTFEIWGALLNGSRLELFPPDFDSIEQLVAVINRVKVTTLWLTAGLFHEVVDGHLEGLREVRQLLAGGDVLSVPHILKVLEHLPHCRLINGYGPTENTTFSCCYTFPRDWRGTSAPIGTPISNTQAYILDEHLQPVPVGIPGELCVAGDGLARGYLNSESLTREKFVSNPFCSGAKLYRTGDRARYREDGVIEFLGRPDDQVKVNGFRIHLSEVEAELLQLPGVRQAAVLAQPDGAGARQLTAFVAADSDLGTSAWRKAAAQRLPSYMVPRRIMPISALPLTANGKVDRRALAEWGRPLKESDRTEASATGGANPREVGGPMQEKVIQVWQEILGCDDIGPDDNFFDLGGHSLLATRVISRLNHAFQAKLSLASLFSAPTVAALAERLAAAAGRAKADDFLSRQRRGNSSAQGNALGTR